MSLILNCLFTYWTKLNKFVKMWLLISNQCYHGSCHFRKNYSNKDEVRFKVMPVLCLRYSPWKTAMLMDGYSHPWQWKIFLSQRPVVNCSKTIKNMKHIKMNVDHSLCIVWHLAPTQPSIQSHDPDTASQAPLFSQSQKNTQPGPYRPGGQTGWYRYKTVNSIITDIEVQ